METVKNNKLIAEFLGYELEETINKELVYPIERQNPAKLNDIQIEFLSPLDLKYGSSWNWLIPVIEVIKDNDPKGKAVHLLDNIDTYLMQTNIKATYIAVVEFINWYNIDKKAMQESKAKMYLCESNGETTVKEQIKLIVNHPDQNEMIDNIDGVNVAEIVEYSFTCKSFLNAINV